MKLSTALIGIAFLLAAAGVDGLENGLARTPPMGWLAWERFRHDYYTIIIYYSKIKML